MRHRMLGDILVDEGLITRERLDEVLGSRTDASEPLGQVLVRMGLISEKDKVRCIGVQHGIPFVDLANREVEPEVGRLITHTIALRFKAIPVEKDTTVLSVAMANPLDVTAIDEMRLTTGLNVEPMISVEDDIMEAIFRCFGAGEDVTDIIGEAIKDVEVGEIQVADDDEKEAEFSLTELKEMVEGAPVVRLVNALIGKAIAARASDIHIEPEVGRVRVRFRVDGMLTEAMSIPKDLQHSVISRIKVMGNMDIAERRAPQDGRITLIAHQGQFDFRISTYPAVYGENVVIRILDKNNARIGLNRLGLQDDVLQPFETLIHRPYGMILVCGPTGSGKTTTLYSALNAINSVERHIITIEDPVEYQLPGIVQANVNKRAGVTFASGLRTIVRQDPDVVMVGEIRDTETAEIAVEAALTGHLVFSTIHSNDSAGTISRLVDMGIEPFLVASSIIAIISQRLVRIVCPRCKMSYTPQEDVLKRLKLPIQTDGTFTYSKGTGCESCSRSGYKGRIGIYELMEVSDKLRELVMAKESSAEIKRQARAEGMRTIQEDAVQKILQGMTTIEEVVRVTHQ